MASAEVNRLGSAWRLERAARVFHYSPGCMQRLVLALNASVRMAHGRTYAGGLLKYEPREIERVLVPPPATLMMGD